jgi:hypothetical protein
MHFPGPLGLAMLFGNFRLSRGPFSSAGTGPGILKRPAWLE